MKGAALGLGVVVKGKVETLQERMRKWRHGRKLRHNTEMEAYGSTEKGCLSWVLTVETEFVRYTWHLGGNALKPELNFASHLCYLPWLRHPLYSWQQLRLRWGHVKKEDAGPQRRCSRGHELLPSPPHLPHVFPIWSRWGIITQRNYMACLTKLGLHSHLLVKHLFLFRQLCIHFINVRCWAGWGQCKSSLNFVFFLVASGCAALHIRLANKFIFP